MEFLRQYEILNKKAIADLKTAKIILESFENGDKELELETIMFHLQQCTEKLIKAILDFNQIKFPHTHDIENLLRMVEENKISFGLDIDVLINLSEYAVEGRYAIIHDDIEDAHQYIKLLEELKIFVNDSINKK